MHDIDWVERCAECDWPLAFVENTTSWGSSKQTDYISTSAQAAGVIGLLVRDRINIDDYERSLFRVTIIHGMRDGKPSDESELTESRYIKLLDWFRGHDCHRCSDIVDHVDMNRWPRADQEPFHTADPIRATVPGMRTYNFSDVRPGDRISMPRGRWYKVAKVQAFGDTAVDVTVVSPEGQKDSWIREANAVVRIDEDA